MAFDYYEILGVTPSATQEEVQRAYRRKAFDLHPDRNGGSREAEEAFKRLTEAYAVLGKPEGRRRYDEARARGAQGFDPADALRDLFADPHLASVLARMAAQMGHHGLRFDEAYLRQMFGRTASGTFVGGFFFVGPWGGRSSSRPGSPEEPTRTDPHFEPTSGRRGLIARLLRAALPQPHATASGGRDIHYTLPLAPETIRNGGTVRIAVPAGAEQVVLDVKVPAGSRDGTRLRLAGRGTGTPKRGDLYLEIRAQR